MTKTKILKLAVFLFCITYLNHCFELFSFSSWLGSNQADLTVMTWNVHCPEGADVARQRGIASLILQEDADFVQLNEFLQDSCQVLDSLLKTKYKFTEEYQSHNKCGDIFYSKREMSNSGHVWIPIVGKSIQTIKATIPIMNDSVQVFGLHMASNNGDGNAFINGWDSLKKMDSFYAQYKIAQQHRCFQANWTKAYVMESSYPVIVMGDMNDFSRSKPLNILRSGGLKNAWWEGGNGYGCTFKKGWMRLRIDHILYDERLKLVNIKVIDTELSDHNPIVAEFSMNKCIY